MKGWFSVVKRICKVRYGGGTTRTARGWRYKLFQKAPRR